MNNKLSGFSSKSVLSSRSLLKVTLWDIFPQENLSEYLKIMVLNIAEHGNYSSELKCLTHSVNQFGLARMLSLEV